MAEPHFASWRCSASVIAASGSGSYFDSPASRRRGARPRNSKHDDDSRRDDGVNVVGADRDVVAEPARCKGDASAPAERAKTYRVTR